MPSFISSYPVADLLFTAYLLIYFPLDALRRSRFKAAPKPPMSALRSYARQGRYILTLLALFMLVNLLEHHTASELGLALPPATAGLWGLAVALGLLISLHFLGTWMESRMTAAERGKQQQKLRALAFPMPQNRIEMAAYCITMVGMTSTWEILFRGYLLLVLTPLIGMPWAVALAALAYGAGHGFESVKQCAGSIAAAFAFTLGYAVTGSLWWLIMLHAAAPLALPFAARKLHDAVPVERVSA
ncbi:MAG: type II CAAX prenyl endopeptidase Rce1 family protein [Sphingomonadaceae bacterium]